MLNPSARMIHEATDDFGGLCILIVEDDADCAETTAVLCRLFGHYAETAGNGLAAVSAIVAKQYDVILLDLALPGISGCDIAEWILKQKPLNPPYLVAITGNACDQIRRQAALCGIDLFLVKPVDPQILKNLLNSLRSRQRS